MNECGECTLCCKLLETHDVASEIGVYCHHCTNIGCGIHKDRPKECRNYQCMWSQMDTVGNELRPDKCGIIFDKISDEVITARLDDDRKIKDLVMGQINSFINEGFSVLIFRGREKKFFMNDKHTKEHVIEAVNDRSLIH